MTEAVQAAPIANDVPDTAIKLYGNKWVATIAVSGIPYPEDGLFHVSCFTVGASQYEANAAAWYVLRHFAAGRVAFIRVEPTAESHRNHLTKETTHRGCVRFSYKLEPGEWTRADQTKVTIPPLFGEQH